MADLDEITRRWTAFPSFQHLIAGGCASDAPSESSYFPSLTPYPFSSAADTEEIQHLARCYDAAQAVRGDARRAYVGETWTPPTPPRPEAPRSPRRGRQLVPALLVLQVALARRGLVDGLAVAALPTTPDLRQSARDQRKAQRVPVLAQPTLPLVSD